MPLHWELQIHHYHAIEAVLTCVHVPDPSLTNCLFSVILSIFYDTPIHISSKLCIDQNVWINNVSKTSG
jgi:hypothetical protein